MLVVTPDKLKSGSETITLSIPADVPASLIYPFKKLGSYYDCAGFWHEIFITPIETARIKINSIFFIYFFYLNLKETTFKKHLSKCNIFSCYIIPELKRNITNELSIE